jgi:hypothetical protein
MKHLKKKLNLRHVTIANLETMKNIKGGLSKSCVCATDSCAVCTENTYCGTCPINTNQNNCGTEDGTVCMTEISVTCNFLGCTDVC